MTKILKVLFNRSYWVVPGQLLAGGYPGLEDPIEEERNLKGLIQAGIRHVISLMEPQEYNRPDDPFAPYVDRMESIGKKIYESTENYLMTILRSLSPETSLVLPFDSS
jgi:hypothetical protein